MRFEDKQIINEKELRDYLESHSVNLTKLNNADAEHLDKLAWQSGGSYIFKRIERELIDSFTGDSYWESCWEVIVD